MGLYILMGLEIQTKSSFILLGFGVSELEIQIQCYFFYDSKIYVKIIVIGFL